MTNWPPVPPDAPNPVYWQVPAATARDDVIPPQLRARFAALVAALAIQGIIALLGVLPALPVAPPVESAHGTAGPAAIFWAQFALLEFFAAVIVSAAFGPVVHLRDVPVIGAAVLGLCFVVIPAVAITLGAIDVADNAAGYGTTAAASSWLTTVFFTTLFFGLPLLALRGRRPE